MTQVRAAMAYGVRTIVDPACMDLARDARLATRVAQETGIQLVLATGIYGQHYTFIPQHFQTRDEDYLADVFVHDIEVAPHPGATLAGVEIVVVAPGDRAVIPRQAAGERGVGGEGDLGPDLVALGREGVEGARELAGERHGVEGARERGAGLGGVGDGLLVGREREAGKG